MADADKFEEVKEGLNLCEGEKVDPDNEYDEPIVPPSDDDNADDSADDGGADNGGADDGNGN